MTIGEEIQWGTKQLGLDKRIEVEMLLSFIVGYTRAKLLAYTDERLSLQQQQAFQQLVERRKAQEPLQYLLGKTNFMGMEFKVTPDVLIPRFDTEILVEQGLAVLQGNSSSHVLDLCTGSGAIAISLAKYARHAEVWATDLSPAALEMADENAKENAVKIITKQGNLFEALGQCSYHQFDLIVSNPPYITTDEVKELPKDVLQEPMMALWGGDDGLYFYRKIAQHSPQYLKMQGYLMMEIGYTQGLAVTQIMEQVGFDNVTVIQDFQGLDRVVFGQWNHG